MYRAKTYRMYNKVLRKYGPKYYRKYGDKMPFFLMYQVLDDEGRSLVNKSGWIGNFAKHFYDNIYQKKADTGEFDDEGNSMLATFRGFILTNRETQYILEYNGQLGMVPANLFAFLNKTNKELQDEKECVTIND